MRPSNRSRALPVLIGALTVLACSSSSPSKGTFPPEASSDATLASLTISAGSLAPAFSAETLEYTAALPNGTTTFTVTPTAASSVAKSVMVQQGTGAFYSVTSGMPSMAFDAPAVQETSKVVVRVTAEDGITIREYAIDVTQEALVVPGAFTIYMIGDSTMADYAEAGQIQGWGYMFPRFLDPSVALVNKARNGRSTKSFYGEEGSWAGTTGVKANLKAGDYVLIQFAHNDQKAKGLEGEDPALDVDADGKPVSAADREKMRIGTAPFGDFKVYLGRFIDEALAAGALPILVTPVVRRDFASGSSALSSYGLHDWTGYKNRHHSIPETQNLNYVQAMKDVAAAKGVQVIDMTSSTEKLVEELGDVVSKQTLYTTGDDTHLGRLGATVVAQLAAEELRDKGIFADHLNPVFDLFVNPAEVGFPSLVQNNKATGIFSLARKTETSEAGEITIVVPEASGFTVGLSKDGPFGSVLKIPFASGDLAPTPVVVQFEPTEAQSYSAAATIEIPNLAPLTVTLKGIGLPLPPPGSVSVTYPLDSATAGCSSSDGSVECEQETFSGMLTAKYNTMTEWSQASNLTNVQCNTTTASGTLASGAWPGDADMVADRYIQFAVRPKAGTTFTVNAISLFAGATGGDKIMYRILYSTNSSFTSPGELSCPTSNPKNRMTWISSGSLAIELTPADTLYVRAYPWYTGDTGPTKSMCLQNLTITGISK